jgi:hypothetical protein
MHATKREEAFRLFPECAKCSDRKWPLCHQQFWDGKLMTDGKQLLHFVFGGELKDLNGTEFRDLSKLDVVGFFPDYTSAVQAWKAKAQATVDNAHMRYFVTHMHRLIDPSKDKV